MRVRYVAGSRTREEIVDLALDKLEGRKQIIFRDNDDLYKAQIVFSRLHIEALTSGLSLYVLDAQEYMALERLRLAGIKIVEPETLQEY